MGIKELYSFLICGLVGATLPLNAPPLVQANAITEKVDLVYYDNQRLLEFDLMAAPGAEPGMIASRLQGEAQIDLDDLDGTDDLAIQTAVGEIRQGRPRIHRNIAAVRHGLVGSYAFQPRGPPPETRLVALWCGA